MIWFPRIDQEAFSALVLEEQRPVVLAVIRYDDSLAPVMEALWALRLAFGDGVALRLLGAEAQQALAAGLGLSEAPFFVVYRQGQELLRFSGRVDGRILEAALAERFFSEIS